MTKPDHDPVPTHHLYLETRPSSNLHYTIGTISAWSEIFILLQRGVNNRKKALNGIHCQYHELSCPFDAQSNPKISKLYRSFSSFFFFLLYKKCFSSAILSHFILDQSGSLLIIFSLHYNFVLPKVVELLFRMGMATLSEELFSHYWQKDYSSFILFYRSWNRTLNICPSSLI